MTLRPILARTTELVKPSIEYATFSTVPWAKPFVFADIVANMV